MNSSRHTRQPAAHQPGPGASTALEVRNVTVRYGSVLALDEASAVIGRGRICGLVGMNGAGKSTLFKSIVGSLKPQSGSVRIAGLPPAKARRAGLIGYVPQAEIVDWDFPITVREVVGTGRYGRTGITRRLTRADQDAVEAALGRVELSELAGRQIGQLSGGQRKRAFVARGLAQGASVLLLDEPFAGVDKRSEQMISTVLREAADAGTTIVVSTHDLHALPDLADEAILLMRRVLLHDSPAEVLRPQNLALAFGLDPLGRPTDTRRADEAPADGGAAVAGESVAEAEAAAAGDAAAADENWDGETR